jgi:sec-independent protein translocase protein TatA
MGSLGMPELLLIALISLIVFGTGRLPELGRGLGEGNPELQGALREGERGEPERTGEEERKDDPLAASGAREK